MTSAIGGAVEASLSGTPGVTSGFVSVQIIRDFVILCIDRHNNIRET
jgi:hypothetical protein